MAENIEQKVKDIIVEQLGVDAGEVKPEASFVNDLGADSLDTVELVMALEESFDMEIPDEEAEKIQTVNQAVESIKNHKKKTSAIEQTAPPATDGFIAGGSTFILSSYTHEKSCYHRH